MDVLRDWRGFGRALGIDEVSLQEIEYAYSLAGECVHLACEKEILEYTAGLLSRYLIVDRTFYVRRDLFIYLFSDLFHIPSSRSNMLLYFQGPKEMTYQVLIKWQRTQLKPDAPSLIRILREHGYKYLAGVI